MDDVHEHAGLVKELCTGEVAETVLHQQCLISVFREELNRTVANLCANPCVPGKRYKDECIVTAVALSAIFIYSILPM